MDLDNTLIDYSNAYAALAPAFGIPPEQATRVGVRSRLRHSDHDDEEWQRFQARLYTDGLAFAQLAPGALTFLQACREAGLSVHVVSHKTPTGPSRFGSPDLREPARRWITQHLEKVNLLHQDHVRFCDTVEQKVATISDLRLEAFVDDLATVLNHPLWPARTLAVLYTPVGSDPTDYPLTADFDALSGWVQAMTTRLHGS